MQAGFEDPGNENHLNGDGVQAVQAYLIPQMDTIVNLVFQY